MTFWPSFARHRGQAEAGQRQAGQGQEKSDQQKFPLSLHHPVNFNDFFPSAIAPFTLSLINTAILAFADTDSSPKRLIVPDAD